MIEYVLVSFQPEQGMEKIRQAKDTRKFQKMFYFVFFLA